MAKIFDRQFEGKYQPRRMNEDRWFSEQQQLLLAMANTDNGRDLLCIRRDFPKIDKIAKNFIRAEIMPGKYVSEFRIGCKYANIIRYRWKEFQEMTQWFYASTYTNVFNMHFPVALIGINRRFTTSIFYPDAAPESTSVDGFTYQNYAVGSGVVWTTIRTDTGNTASDSGTDGYIFRAIGDNTAGTPYWYRNYRSIMLFDTSIIGGDSIVSAVFSPYGKAKLDEPSITPSCNVYSSNPTLNTALQGSDYSTVGTTAYCDTPITYANYGVDQYNDFTFNATGLSAVNGSDITKLSCYNANYDADNSVPAWHNQISYLETYYADQTGTDNDPKLTVVHNAPSSGSSLVRLSPNM